MSTQIIDSMVRNILLSWSISQHGKSVTFRPAINGQWIYKPIGLTDLQGQQAIKALINSVTTEFHELIKGCRSGKIRNPRTGECFLFQSQNGQTLLSEIISRYQKDPLAFQNRLKYLRKAKLTNIEENLDDSKWVPWLY